MQFPVSMRAAEPKENKGMKVVVSRLSFRSPTQISVSKPTVWKLPANNFTFRESSSSRKNKPRGSLRLLRQSCPVNVPKVTSADDVPKTVTASEAATRGVATRGFANCRVRLAFVIKFAALFSSKRVASEWRHYSISSEPLPRNNEMQRDALTMEEFNSISSLFNWELVRLIET